MGVPITSGTHVVFIQVEVNTLMNNMTIEGRKPHEEGRDFRKCCTRPSSRRRHDVFPKFATRGTVERGLAYLLFTTAFFCCTLSWYSVLAGITSYAPLVDHPLDARRKPFALERWIIGSCRFRMHPA